jgi:DNA-binding transcriptional ArsR family regulator
MMRGWILLVAGVLLVVPSALAAEGTLTGRAELPIEVTGTHEATGSDARFLLEGTDGQASLLVHGADGTATRVIHRAFGYVIPTDPQAKVLWGETVETVDLPLSGSLLSLEERRPEFRLLTIDGLTTMESGADGSPLLVGALEQAKSVDYALEEMFSFYLNPPSQEDQFHHLLPAGTFQARADDGRVQVEGPFQLFITDAVLTYRAETSALQQIPAHFRIEMRPGTFYNPVSGTWLGGGEHPEYVQEYLLLDATSGHLDLNFVGAQGSLYSPRPVVAIEGTAFLPAMDGSVTIVQDDKATRHAIDGSDLELSGIFTLRMHDVVADPARTQVEGSGDITDVTYDGTSASYDWMPVAAAAGLGALLLAIGAWILGNAKAVGGLGGGLLAGYARVQGQEVLEHPGRQEVYERVKAAPGINFVQLSEQVAFGSSTLNYHLRVLEKNEYITSVKDGRYLRFFDRQAGTYSGSRKTQVSALRNTTTAAMARHIRDHPGVAQCDLAAAFGVTASTVNWHMTRLTGAGLVDRQRDAHYTRYYLSQGWSQLPTSEMDRLGTAAPAPMLVAPIAV